MRFRKIDESNRGDHTRLHADDECYYLHEYTSGQSFIFGEANNLISNLKKSVEKVGKPEYLWKVRAMSRCSDLIGGAINADWLKTGVLVPVPPSKAKGHPHYDDRLSRICRGIAATHPIDVRELVVQRSTIRAAHENPGDRPSVAELESIYEVNENLCEPAFRAIAIVDDVLTAGTHYRAMHNVLCARFPWLPIVGMFIARRVFATAASADLEGL